MEIILSKVFKLPDIPLFKRFKACRGAINRQNFSELQVTPEASSFSEATVAFLTKEHQQEQIRDDYMELNELWDIHRVQSTGGLQDPYIVLVGWQN
jgi:hypothetical protein